MPRRKEPELAVFWSLANESPRTPTNANERQCKRRRRLYLSKSA